MQTDQSAFKQCIVALFITYSSQKVLLHVTNYFIKFSKDCFLLNVSDTFNAQDSTSININTIINKQFSNIWSLAVTK